MLAFCPVIAQDTIQIRDMRLINRYFVPEWPDAFPTVRDSKGNEYLHGYLENAAENYSQSKQKAYYMYTSDTLHVYGIAASLSTHWRLNPNSTTDPNRGTIVDTSCEFLYDYLRLYEADPDSLRHIGEELLVNLRYTPVSYYIDLDLFRSFSGTYDSVILQPILPMYERYFTTPVTVVDSFYIGRRYRTDHRDGRQVLLLQLADSLYHGTNHEAIYWDYDGYWNPAGWAYQTLGPRQLFPFLFPIIAPPDTTTNPSDTTVVTPIDTVINLGDTLVVLPGDTLIIGGDTIVNTGDTIVVTPGGPIIIGGDTIVVNPGDSIVVNPVAPSVGLLQPDPIYRYTALQPNPASDKVKVLSSFGISRIEAYDLKGRKVSEFRTLNSEFSITLDVSSWPRGTYLLRITTPVGQTTKKLLLR